MSEKYSKQKETLLKVLSSTTCHPDADWIYEQVKKQLPNISLGTVYRNLAKMSQQGTILRLNVDDGRDHFDADTANHYHMVCRNCREIVDIFAEKNEQNTFKKYLDSFAQSHTDAVIETHNVIFYGLCNKCKSE